MYSRFFFVFIFFSLKCFCSSSFLYKNAHIPPSGNIPNSICFYTTHTLDDGFLKKKLMNELKTTFKIEAFVETGTYLEDTTVKAAQIFDEVHTIELSQELYLKASQRLKMLHISPVMRSCALHRLEPLEELKEIGVYYQTYSPFELEYGYRSFGGFWYALTLMKNGKKKQVQSLLKKTAGQSLLCWRVDKCIY